MMGQRQREQVQRGCAVGTVVLLAWLCRVLPLEGLPSGLQEACGILRSLLYLSLFAGWGISLYNRTVHPQVRRLLLNVDLLMLFWILVRTLRFQLNTPPGMDRMLGYLYYAPMLGIPVLCVQLVLTVDRSERYRLSAWARMLWLPSAVLLELVLTNDLHQQVFRLQQPWNENYQYGWLFGLVVGWIVICILLAFGIIAHKSRNPRILRRLPLPAIPMVLLGVYAVLYGFHIPLIKQFLGDMTIVHCLMTAASLEGGLRCGLIQSNTGYEELLRVTSLAVQLVDRQGNVYCCSENGRMVDRRELQAAMHGTVQLDEHTLLRSAPVQGGYVMWQTDITELVENMERLKENRTELAERNYLEQQNYEVERKINALREKKRLYDLLQRQLAPQIIRMDQLLTRYRAAPEEEKRQLLGQVAVLGAYLKRGANLMFLAQQHRYVPSAELRYALEESISSLELAGVECIFSEVTDLQRQRQELLRQNQELLRMNRELRRLSENVQEMTREKEILEFKTRLHDEMGYGLTAVRQCLLQRKDPAELEASLEQMNKAVQLYRKDSEAPPEENEWDVFVEDAAQLGVTVALQGPMPRQHQQLLLTIARECITNAVRYAGANRLEITITPQGGGQRWQFENDGPPPADPAITPGGGLTAIQRRVMQAGGTMEVQARPRYRLCVNLPKEETI